MPGHAHALDCCVRHTRPIWPAPQVEEEPSGSDEEGWDAPAPAAQADGEEPDFDEDDSSDDELLLDELAADRGL